MPVFGGGHSKFQPIHVNNLVEIMVKAMESSLNGQVIEAGGPKGTLVMISLDSLYLS
jgi:hypothetical protein